MTTIIHLEARQPFSLHSVINSHGWIQLAPFCQLPVGEGFTYTDRLQTGKTANLVVEPETTGVSVKINQSITPAELDEIRQKITWMLGLDLDFSEFYNLTDREPKLANARRLAQGRVLRSPTLFEDTVKTILTTNTVWGSTRRMVERLVAKLGIEPSLDSSMPTFPTPRQIASSSQEFLRSEIRLGYRAPYVYELGKRVAEGDLDLESLKHSRLDTAELHKRLLEIKGVGKYAAANLLMLLGRYDSIPVDSWALKMVSNEWYGGEPVTPVDVTAAFERFGAWKGLAFWLWDWGRNGN